MPVIKYIILFILINLIVLWLFKFAVLDDLITSNG